MRRILAVLTLLSIAALTGGCASSSDTNKGSSPNATANSAAPSSAAPNMPKSAPQSPTLGSAPPPQAKPSPTSEAGIKPPTKNQQ